jgi:15-cis-phytoene desaturase
MSYDVIVVGGGLAGLSTAYHLVKEKNKVLLLEAREVLGGRTSSWNEKGMDVESGLHRFLGFYSELPKLIEGVGLSLDDVLIWEDEIEIRTPEGVNAVFQLAPLFKPLKTVASILGNNDFLSPGDKLALGKFMALGLKDFVSDPDALDKISVYDYAKKHDIDEKVIQRVLVPFTTGLFFLPIKEYSAFSLFGLLPPSLPKSPMTRIGAFKGGMSDVMCDPIGRYIVGKGAKVQRKSRVTSLLMEDERVVGVRVGQKALRAKHVVVATSLGPAQELLGKHFRKHEFFKDFFSLPTMPAVTIQIELDRPSMDVDHTTFGPGTILASFAEQSRTTFRDKKGRISIILSPPEKYLKMDHKKILDETIAEARKIGIELDGHVKDFRIVTEPMDFYSLSMNNQHLRPSQETPIRGLTLAGDYTKQRFLATMEGAVISGEYAAEVVNKSLDT